MLEEELFKKGLFLLKELYTAYKSLSPLDIAILSQDFDEVNKLIDEGADINDAQNNLMTPLLWAVSTNNIYMCRLLLSRGANVNLKNRNSYITPLLMAIEKNYAEICKLLIESGADLDMDNDSEITPLILAAKLNNIEMCKLLIEAGADFDKKDKSGNTPLFFAIKNNNVEIFQKLLECNANITCVANNGNTPLLLAIGCNHTDMGMQLIKSLQLIDITQKTKMGVTPLMYACEQNTDLAIALINAGADVNEQDYEKLKPFILSPLFLVINNNRDESTNKNLLIKLLLDKGANPNIYCLPNQTTILMIAVSCNNIQAAELLLNAGANLTFSNTEGFTAFKIAKNKGHIEMLKFLNSRLDDKDENIRSTSSNYSHKLRM